MEGFDLKFQKGRKPVFDEAPAEYRRSLMGVDYLHLRGLQGGDLIVTRHGWPLAESLLPDQWFVGKRFCKVGRALAGATGAVYRVPVPHPRLGQTALVVKFSRFAQSVNLTVMDSGLRADAALNRYLDDAQFLSPFEEFANLSRLRRTAGGRVLTARPLAIYLPPTRYAAWELGRSNTLFQMHQYRLKQSQAGSESELLRYDPERIYILLYHWVEGIDAEEACNRKMISETQVRRLTDVARQAMLNAGWLVLDHKPKHVIVRPTKDESSLVMKGDLPIWAMIDYELLIPLKPAEASAE